MPLSAYDQALMQDKMRASTGGYYSQPALDWMGVPIRPVGVGGGGGGGGNFPPASQIGSGGTGVAAPVNEQAERARILELFRQAEGAYRNDPTFQEVLDLMMGRARGQQQPFTPQVRAGMFSQEEDAAQGAFNNERNMIMTAMANAGMTGSGAQTSAMLDAMNRRTMRTGAARRDINTRSQLENFSAQERAQQQAAEYLRARAMHEAGVKQNEATYRAGLRETPQMPQDMGPRIIPGGNAWGPTPSGVSAFDASSWERMLQQMSEMPQDYYGNPMGSPGYNSQPPPSGGKEFQMNGWQPRQPQAPMQSGAGQDQWGFMNQGQMESKVGPLHTIMKNFGLE